MLHQYEDAQKACRSGRRIRRSKWRDDEWVVHSWSPRLNRFSLLLEVGEKKHDDTPWRPHIVDLLANDWVISDT